MLDKVHFRDGVDGAGLAILKHIEAVANAGLQRILAVARAHQHCIVGARRILTASYIWRI
jgi:hypothetical protein